MSADTVQVDYQQLETIASRFGQKAEDNTALDSQVRRCLADLQQGGWVGEGAKAFFTEMEKEILPAMGRLIQALQESQNVTRQIIIIMQQAEEEAAEPFKNGTVDMPHTTQPNQPKEVNNTNNDNQAFNWWGFVGGTADSLANILEFAGIASANPVLIGAGVVFDFVALGAGIGEDLSQGESLGEALTSEVTETFAGKYIDTFLYKQTGGGMVVYDAAMLVGNLASGGLELARQHDEADWLQNTLDAVDIDNYVDQLVEGGYNLVAPAAKDITKEVLHAGADLLDDAAGLVDAIF